MTSKQDIVKLWRDVSLVYDRFSFTQYPIQNDLMIVFQENFYLIKMIGSDLPQFEYTEIRIEKNEDLTSISSEFVPLRYRIQVTRDESILLETTAGKVQVAYNALKPFLRQFKLDNLGL